MKKEVRCQTPKQRMFHYYSPVYSSVIDPIAKFSEEEDRIALPEK